MTLETRVYRLAVDGEQFLVLALDGATAASEAMRVAYAAHERASVALFGNVAVESVGPALPSTIVWLGEVESR